MRLAWTWKHSRNSRAVTRPGSPSPINQNCVRRRVVRLSSRKRSTSVRSVAFSASVGSVLPVGNSPPPRGEHARTVSGAGSRSPPGTELPFDITWGAKSHTGGPPN